MKKTLFVFLLTLVAGFTAAQDTLVNVNSFNEYNEFEELDSLAQDSAVEVSRIPVILAMEDNVTIHQSDEIEQLLFDKISGIERQVENVTGYRVQVFSDNSPQNAKTAAFELQKRLESENLGQEIYVLYNPPFWKVRLGNFLTQNEAILLRDEIRRRFPEIQGDTYIVRDQIQIKK